MISIASEVLTGIKFIAGVVSQVKDNQADLRRTSARLRYLLDTIERSRKPPTKQDGGAGQEEYDRAMLTLLHTNEENFEALSVRMQDIFVKLAVLEVKLQTPIGEKWPDAIAVDARKCLEADRAEAEAAFPMLGIESSNIPTSRRSLLQRTLRLPSTSPKAPGHIPLLDPSTPHPTVNVHITNLRLRGAMRFRKQAEPVVILTGLRREARPDELAGEIRAQGYEAPSIISSSGGFTVTVSDKDVFDACAPGGLQISSSTPLIHYYTKYNAYHNITPSHIPSHTTASAREEKSVTVGGVEFRFHRTLRVPEGRVSQLPPSLGLFPVIPVGKFGSRVPESTRKRGGFVMPVFEREAMWMSFHLDSKRYISAVKVSVGGVNAITGVANDSHTPPRNTQDYIVAGTQPWLDGIMTETGVVRQFVAMSHGKNYTVEEQITGQATTGGFQFDVFPLRDSGFVATSKGTWVRLAQHMTPADLLLQKGEPLIITRTTNPVREGFTVQGRWEPMGSSWSLARFQPGADGAIWLTATYSSDADAVAARAPILGKEELFEKALGLAAGGQITQRIYGDTRSIRMYDEEKGHRFHLHIISPEAWEVITGVLPPITPVSEEMYKMHKIPWYKLADDHLPVLPSSASTPLSGVKSVAQLDSSAKQAEIDPSRPPGCSVHASAASTCVFRPCSHTACSACLGAAMMARMACPVPACNVQIA
ncbi:hypothetical protein HYDPIDRAFT_27346 [Hydnomerulius pinastri MD-312]|nr:hypothetical protein HYDPIDRAFT_27346 [Hydnomerulius pinastri MD-312]